MDALVLLSWVVTWDLVETLREAFLRSLERVVAVSTSSCSTASFVPVVVCERSSKNCRMEEFGWWLWVKLRM